MSPEELKAITDFRSFIEYLREELDWDIPDDLGLEQLTYTYTAAELGLKIDAQVEIKQLRPILGQQSPWGVFFIDFDKAELPVTLLRRILSSVSRRKRESTNPGDRALFGKNDLLFVSAFGKADDRKLALAHFHQEPDTNALPTLRVLSWDRFDTPRHMATVAERLARLRWPGRGELPETWKARWSNAFIDRPRAAISTAKDMAAALADCARQIREAIQDILPREREGQPLSQLFEAVKATLNKDLDVPKFADTYAQTIAYGLLSKRIDQIQRWRAEKARTLDGALPLPTITIDALEQAIPTNPFLSELLTSFLAAGGRDGKEARLDFDELGLGDVVHLLNTANMEAVLDDFDKDKQGDDPVIHFYEGFLAAYDKAMKVQRGVFYTPKPVVSFIVRSVDEVLRTEFGLPLGLADTMTWGQFIKTHPDAKIPKGASSDDPFVKILDPATGTGTFLVEVIDLIHRRMMDEAWKGKLPAEKTALWSAYVAEHLLPRLYGYELMMAPYAVAHMKIGLKLADTDYDFSGTEAGPGGNRRPTRARVFLTNALEPAHDFDMQLAFMNEALAHEAKAANEAKSEAFTVVIGNPPYQGISSNMQPWAQKLVDRFRFIDGNPLGERKSWLQNDYVKFFSFVMSAIERTGVGTISLITDNSYLDGPTFRGLRYQQITTWDTAWVLDLGGKSTITTGGARDENVFDIQQGVAIISLSRGGAKGVGVRVGAIRGTETHKLAELNRLTMSGAATREGFPRAEFYEFFSDSPNMMEIEYSKFESISYVFPFNSVGVQTSRDHLSVGFTTSELTATLERFSDPNRTDDDVRLEFFGTAKADAKYPSGDTRGWHVDRVRTQMTRSSAWRSSLEPIAYRPFDVRVFGADELLSDWPRPELGASMRIGGNVCLNVVRRTENRRQYDYVFVSSHIPSNHLVSLKDGSYGLPLWLGGRALSAERPNLSRAFTSRLSRLTDLRFDDGSDAPAQGALPGLEAPPTMQGALRLHRERGNLNQTFGARDVFDWIYSVLHSPSYRDRYAEFLKSDFARVPLPKNRELFAALVVLGRKLVALHLLDTGALSDLLVDPKVRFVSNSGQPRLGRFNKEARRDASGRVYLNDHNWFATVPQAAWDHWIGGYQPAQKWLKDRSQTGAGEKLKPGRLLTDEDILHYRRMIVALEETGKVMAEIDEVIARHGGWPEAFRGMKD